MGALTFIREGVVDFFTTYSSQREIEVPRTKIALLYRILQLIIVAYIALFMIWWEKGYQEFQEPRGSSVIKVKGIAQVAPAASNPSKQDQFLWDTPEYQLPALEQNALFIVTRKLVTYDQKEGFCASALADKLFCTQDNQPPCIPKQSTSNTFGYFTGRCIPSPQNTSIRVCEIQAWCPEEQASSDEYFVDLNELRSFTIFVKTLVNFHKFNIPLRNVLDGQDLSCRFNKNDSKLCPIFRIGDILDEFENTNQTALVLEGGVIEIVQNWDCNFDFSPPKCDREYSFNLLQSGDDTVSPGINYRAADKYEVNGTTYRTLSKISGLRFVVTVSGTGGRFNILNLFIAIGSGIGYLVIASIVTECVFIYCHSQRERYREVKVANLIFDIENKNLLNPKAQSSDTINGTQF